MKPLSTQSDVNWDDFWPAERQAVTVGDKIIGVPALVDNLSLVYNKKLFDQAGVPYPTPDWTWDDFRAAAKKLTDPSKKQFGWAYVADGGEDTVWRFDALLWQAGGDILNSDNTQAEFNSDAGREGATLLQQMATVDHSVYLDNGNGNYANLFNSGKIAMLYTGPWDLSGFPDVDYGIQILPGDQSHATISGPDQWVMFDNGEQRRDAAWTFSQVADLHRRGDEVVAGHRRPADPRLAAPAAVVPGVHQEVPGHPDLRRQRAERDQGAPGDHRATTRCPPPWARRSRPSCWARPSRSRRWTTRPTRSTRCSPPVSDRTRRPAPSTPPAGCSSRPPCS